jgi:hypothetical protein
MAGSVLWAETPDENRDEAERAEAADVDESFAARRLRRWIKGMFGGTPAPEDKPTEPTQPDQKT